MATRQLVRNATVFDSAAGRLRPGCQIVIEGERIVAVSETPLQVDDAAQVIDAGGRVVLPGLIDAHVHVVASSHDLSGLALQPPSLVTAQSSRILRDMLQRGFTTVRDAAGADFGLQEAVERGLFEGPRLFIAGFPDQPDRRPCRHAAQGRAPARVLLHLRRPGPDRRHRRRRGRGAARGARAGAQRRQPDQDHGRRRHLQPQRPARRHAVLAWRNCAPPARRPRPPTCTRWRMPIRRAR